jgi:hypothetical protein
VSGCRCEILKSGAAEFDLIQVGPGVVRASYAERTTSSSNPRDAFLFDRMRRADLDPDLRRPPILRLFGFTELLLKNAFDGVYDESGMGVPVASPRWQLRVLPTGVQQPDRWMPAFLESIEEIDLKILYEAFNPKPQS